MEISRNFSFLGLVKPRMLFFLLINVKMPTIVGILTLMSRKSSCSAEFSMNIFLFMTWGPNLQRPLTASLNQFLGPYCQFNDLCLSDPCPMDVECQINDVGERICLCPPGVQDPDCVEGRLIIK